MKEEKFGQFDNVKEKITKSEELALNERLGLWRTSSGQ